MLTINFQVCQKKTRKATTQSCSSSAAAQKSLGSQAQTTALNEVAAARSDGPTSKSKLTKPKAPIKTSKEPKIVKMVEDDESEIPALGDEDDTNKHEAALASPMKGKDFQQSTAMRIT